jgi:hypothetical protein
LPHSLIRCGVIWDCTRGLHQSGGEPYSKWMHWTLKQFAECGTLGEILDLPIPSASNTSGIQLFNERTIRSRDRKRFGRIDIVVWHGEMSAILEIKTKSFTEEALEKHLLYYAFGFDGGSNGAPRAAT